MPCMMFGKQSDAPHVHIELSGATKPNAQAFNPNSSQAFKCRCIEQYTAASLTAMK